MVRLSVAGVTLGTMTDGSGLTINLDYASQELSILLSYDASPADEQVATAVAQACVGTGRSIRCHEEDRGLYNKIRVKVDPDSVFGKIITDTT